MIDESGQSSGFGVVSQTDTITAIKKDVEAEIERVVQSVNEWDDRTSPDDYPEHLLITSEELADILRNFAEATLESLQRENQESKELARAFEAEANQLREVSIANRHRAERAEAELKRLEEWKPISEADTSITNTITMPGLTVRNSDSYWVRDDDGRIYEACWTDHRNGYWWDIEGESPVDPVEFMPHPLSRRPFQHWRHPW